MGRCTREHTRVLTQILEDEKKRGGIQREPPFPFMEDVTAIRAKIENLLDAIRPEVARTLTQYSWAAIGSRIVSIDGRVRRLRGSNPEENLIAANIKTFMRSLVDKFVEARAPAGGSTTSMSVHAAEFVPVANVLEARNVELTQISHGLQLPLLPAYTHATEARSLTVPSVTRDSVASFMSWTRQPPNFSSTGWRNAVPQVHESPEHVPLYRVRENSPANAFLPLTQENIQRWDASGSAIRQPTTNVIATTVPTSAQNVLSFPYSNRVHTNHLIGQFPTQSNFRENLGRANASVGTTVNGPNTQHVSWANPVNHDTYVHQPQPHQPNNLANQTFPINFQSQLPNFQPSLNASYFQEMPSNQYRSATRLKPVPIHQWKITFSGEDKKVSSADLSVHDFVFQVNVQKQVQGIPDVEMLGQISTLLTHGARTWYLSNYGRFHGWNDFVDALQQRFRPNYSLIDAISELSNRRQKKNETPIAYLNQMVMAIRTLPVNLTEQQQVDLIQRNLLPEVQMAVAPWQPRTVGHLEHILSLMNINRPSEVAQQATKRFFVRKSVNAVQSEESEELEAEIEFTEEEICAVLRARKLKQNVKKSDAISEEASKPNKRADIKCHNCRESGHVFKDCPKPQQGIFCFKCGKDEVKSFECPDCQKNVAACLVSESEATPEPDK